MTPYNPIKNLMSGFMSSFLSFYLTLLDAWLAERESMLVTPAARLHFIFIFFLKK